MYLMSSVALSVILFTTSVSTAADKRPTTTNNTISSLQPLFRSPTPRSSLNVPTVRDAYDLSSLKDLCPYADICQYPGQAIPAKKISCCSSCSCDPSCGTLGNCCDNDLNVNTSGKCYEPRATNEASVTTGIGYWLTDRCSNSSSCKHMTSEPWGPMYPVYDVATDVSFYNQHCAECNGVHVYKHWDVGLHCRQTQATYTNTMIVGGLLGTEECEIIFTPPKEQNEEHVCYTNPIQQCNVTGLWQTHDLGLELACSRWFSPVSMDRSKDTFANIFCLLCNGMYYEKERLCSSVPSKNTLEKTTFTTTIDYRKIADALADSFHQQTKKGDIICRKHMMKHPFKVTSQMQISQCTVKT